LKALQHIFILLYLQDEDLDASPVEIDDALILDDDDEDVPDDEDDDHEAVIIF
jgi:E3 ubiquitin-protein ligase TRIP12